MIKTIRAVSVGRWGQRTAVKLYEVRYSKGAKRYSWRLAEVEHDTIPWWYDPHDPRSIERAKAYAKGVGLPFLQGLKQYDEYKDPLILLGMVGAEDEAT